MELSIIIPAYNEAARIKPMLTAYLERFSKKFSDFEFLVMIEGTDDTSRIVEEFAKKDKRVKYLYSKERLGKGGAIIKGFGKAKGDIIGFVDADGSTNPEAFLQLFSYLGKCDGAIASRKIPGAKIIRQEPLLQRFGSWGFNSLVRFLFFLPFKDTQCGAKVFRKEAIAAALPDLTLANFAFDIDLLYVLHKLNFKIAEVSTVWEYKTGAQFNFSKWFWKLVPLMFLSIVRLRLIHSPFAFIVGLYNKFFHKVIFK